VNSGNAFASNLLRPTINGVVVPVISISLGTLVSTTVNVLRDRQVTFVVYFGTAKIFFTVTLELCVVVKKTHAQVEMRALINKEVCELRLLRRAVFGMFGTRQHARRRIQALELMRGYTEQLESESTVGGVDGLNDLQLRGGIAVNELDSMAEMLHGIDGAAASRQGSVGVAETLIVSLNGHRSNRVALLLSGFPAIHWVILGGLSASVCVAFLLVSDQEVLQYLNSVQLRALFSILVGVLSGTAALCFDLADPFRGSFCISSAASQLGDLKVALQQDLAEAGAEAPDTGSLGSQFKTWAQKKELDMDTARRIRDQGRSQLTQTAPQGSDVNISTNALAVVEDTANSSTGHVLPPLLLTQDSPRSRSRYGLASTLYFHLLTGPLGFNVRALGDLFAWVVSFVSQHSRGVVAWCHRSGSFLTRKPPGKRRGTGTSPPLAGA
jgi:hypothetical protein